MNKRNHLVVIGAGAAGYFAALNAQELDPSLKVTILEAEKKTLRKVLVSGGGRCNVTNGNLYPKEVSPNYPRGKLELLGPLHKFGTRETLDWFEDKGVSLKVESDGRAFPTTDSSQTIVDCFERLRDKLGVELRLGTKVTSIKRVDEGFVVRGKGFEEQAEKVIIATGASKVGYKLAESLGHTVSSLIPSLFTFQIDDKELHKLSGLGVASVSLSLPEFGISQSGPLLVTHWGLSGPAVIKLSAFAAKELHSCDYKTKLLVDWNISPVKKKSSKALIKNSPPCSIPKRLWAYLLGAELDSRFCDLPKAELDIKSEFEITGKGVFKEEFVTCGGVDLSEVDFRTMESKLHPGLFFSGEVLNIDGVTGGFNFQSAWTASYLAAQAISSS